MTENDFQKYKDLSNKVLNILADADCASLRDIKIIYNTLMGFPYCLSKTGEYVYKGKFYKDVESTPKEAFVELYNHLTMYSHDKV